MCVTTVQNYEFVYFRMISWGSRRHGEILHLAAQCGDAKFCVWVTPSKRMNSKGVQEMHGLECRGVELFYRKQRLLTKPLKEALKLFHKFLESLTAPVLLVTHLGELVYKLLCHGIIVTSMVDLFDQVIVGFADIDPILRKKLPDRMKNHEWKITELTQHFFDKKYVGTITESYYMIAILKELTEKFTEPYEWVEVGTSYGTAISQEIKENRELRHLFEDLKPLIFAVGWDTVIMMVQAGLSYSTLIEVFQKTGSKGLQEFLYEKQINSEPRYHFGREKLQKITRFFGQQKQNQKTDEGPKGPGSNLDSFMIEEYPVDQIPLVNPVPMDQFPVDENERDRALMEEWHEKCGRFF